jgi:hypothetical protein
MVAWEVRHLRSRPDLPQHLDDLGRAMAAYFHRAGRRGDERFLRLIDELIAMREEPLRAPRPRRVVATG